MYYAPKIFEIAGYTNTTQQMWSTVIVGLVNVLATFNCYRPSGSLGP
ncbi:sugar (and other) transporter family protein [Candidatus Erwinia dacicola]|uniref:Sugar (And other) transporter family protein n=1 Tax=Candidatus Erwinia dacicola TaxID=252393 RepID=A0A328TD44_9GAMM|nr:sugar (and other) transporter family protein [Candidatus Erwinia dacicola]